MARRNPRYTLTEAAEKFGVEREDVAGLVKFLDAWGLVENCGERPSPTGRGRGEAVYEFEDNYEKNLERLLKRAKLNG